MKFVVDALVTPTLLKQLRKCLADVHPLFDGEASNAGQPYIVIWQPIMHPVVHDQQQVRSVLDRC